MAGISGFISNNGAIQPERFLLAFENIHRISGIKYVKYEYGTVKLIGHADCIAPTLDEIGDVPTGYPV